MTAPLPFPARPRVIASGRSRPMPLPLALFHAVRISRQFRDPSISAARLGAVAHWKLAALRHWDHYRAAARSIARYPRLDAFLRRHHWI
ncbi:hypothetical protein KBZ18_10075 [Synechococcus sp. Cruz-9H2]|uniref:hypothetical protein n=1 Tax=unclassified Synechococcus TaxID=2626047 RepID=UPI0020CC9C12|nr:MULTISPECIES: hypothetical protein [unclassified Synechococcus]MCP9819839.1 hypothetical protein [Synechococcus sp. Cruz-9H2]MCP9844095.1 hypothetical protein [Synechococcus sp. Edmonson 11F2]MCP9856269.1 hypothetical protein [Synechococcus sp. Cruz-9C9]MCP9863554.1 hypothetical protein [Synechococcus sp. Cruz-7E5]MCP9870750.1 hypothetical protein [Synechococcus sp. Cruz-7B9]